MRFRVSPFSHPEYLRLRERSEPLANLWGFGHAVFVVFLALAVAAPVGVAMAAMIDTEISRDRVWDVAESSAAAALLFAPIGFAFRRYARKKGMRFE